MERPAKLSKQSIPQTSLLELPQEVMLIIFIKLGVFDLVLNARHVCSLWRAIAKDPQLYRVIHIIRNVDIPKPAIKLVESVVIEAIKRSHGQLAELSIEYFCTDQILYALMHASPLLKILRLRTYDHFTVICLMNVIQKLKLLEEVEFLDCSFRTTCMIEAVGRSCPNLKKFRLNPAPPVGLSSGDKVAFAVTDNMNPGLQILDMPKTLVNDDGLEALLERFSQLEYLGIQLLHNMDNGDLDEDLLTKFKGIKVSRYRIW